MPKRNSQDLIKSFLKTNVVTQCPNVSQSQNQSIKVKGAAAGAGRNKPSHH